MNLIKRIVRKIFKVLFLLASKIFKALYSHCFVKCFSHALSLQQRVEGVFVTLHKRPIFSTEITTVTQPPFKKTPPLAIIIQGALLRENDFTLETVRIYKKHFLCAKIILSTWNTEDYEYLEKFSSEGIDIVLSEKPLNLGISNVNLQIQSTKAGMARAKQLGCEYAIKTRSDQRIYATDIEEFLFNLLDKFPLHDEVQVQRKRLVVFSLNTFLYRVYGISDMFMFGNIDDMLLYWSPDFDSRNPAAVEKDLSKSILSYSTQRICEVYFCSEFLSKIGVRLDFTLEDSWRAYARHFCVVDKETLDLCWPKYCNLEFRWLSYRPNHLEEVTFKDWFNLYCSDGKKKTNLSHYVGKNFSSKICITRTACLGNFALQQLNLRNISIINHQKLRVDYALHRRQNPKNSVNYKKIKNYVNPNNIGVAGLWKELERDIFSYDDPSCLIMDSFSELTDKLFVSRDFDDAFLSHYSDIDHSGDFDQRYTCQGLLSINSIEQIYSDFFDAIIATYGEIPIVFIHFPAVFDKRDLYRDRASSIITAINNLSLRFHNLIPIELSNIKKSPNDDFPYHFSGDTIFELSTRIQTLRVFG